MKKIEKAYVQNDMLNQHLLDDDVFEGKMVAYYCQACISD